MTPADKLTGGSVEAIATPAPDVAERFPALEEQMGLDEYNFKTFRTKHLLQDARRTVEAQGIKPGELAPDFELPSARGGMVRLSSLRGKPVLLHFGSLS